MPLGPDDSLTRAVRQVIWSGSRRLEYVVLVGGDEALKPVPDGVLVVKKKTGHVVAFCRSTDYPDQKTYDFLNTMSGDSVALQ